MNIKIYIPYHTKKPIWLKRSIEDIEQQIVSKKIKCRVFIDIIANGNAEQECPVNNKKFKYITRYKFYKNINSAAEARNCALFNKNVIGFKKIDLIIGHDYDDQYIGKKVLQDLIEPFTINKKLVMAFGNNRMENKLGRKFINKNLYPDFLDISDFFKNSTINKNNHQKLISYILKTYHFPTQATIYKYDLLKKINGYPLITSMEDRLMTIKFLMTANQLGLPIQFINKDFVCYLQHPDSTSECNLKNNGRIIIINDIRAFLKNGLQSVNNPIIKNYLLRN